MSSAIRFFLTEKHVVGDALELMEKYHKPTFVIEEMDDKAKGSARSCGDFNLALALDDCRDLLLSGGGHKFAAGVKLPLEKIDEFKTKINHTGLDISAPKGTEVTAADAGEVLYTGWMRGYGQVIIIDHGGNLTTVYAHLSKIECTEDQKVSRGTTIGRVGSTGIATGNHLHFEVRVNGDAVNPMRYLK